jgi:hypothetical protein
MNSVYTVTWDKNNIFNGLSESINQQKTVGFLTVKAIYLYLVLQFCFMKNLLLLIILFSVFAMHAQVIRQAPKRDSVSFKKDVPFIYVGGGTGINNVCGFLGALVTVKASDNFFLRVGAGIGGWGTKFTGGFKYELKTSSSWGFGASFSSCSGLKNFKTNLEVIDSGKVVRIKQVNVDLLRSSTVNLTASYKWLIKNKHYFYVDLGYALAIETDPYKVLDGSVLSDRGKAVLHTLQPGGIIFGIGILFGIQ